MSPNNKKKLNLIRIKLDKLDNKLLSLIKYRTSLVKEVLNEERPRIINTEITYETENKGLMSRPQRIEDEL